MSELLTRLQAAVGDAYRIEKELGGGGMSRVFVAEEVALERPVVIKVLPPEMAAGVNADRFRREILLAAKLQHPHVVPVLTAGAKDDILYYVMPLIRGESLRARLAREGELPVGQAVRILRDVADALSYAHRAGVVHRDIKPDNVLLADGHAVVTDFGVAKAVASSTGESSLTSLGVALGTPAYMAPEQAAADPHVDHRADLYGLGAMAYEMLCGRPPFTGGTPQAILAAHVTQAPEPVTLHRATVPPGLAEAVMRCLAKKPADRFQKADELVPFFDGLLTPSGGMTPTGTQPVPAVDHGALARRAHPVRVGLLFALAAIGVLAVVYGAVQAIGLPDWVFWGAIGLLLAGLPIVLLTGHLERKRALARSTGVQTVTPTGVKRLFTWRRSLTGGGAAFALLAVAAIGFMALRAAGVGPFATLVSAGRLPDRPRVLVADFTNRTSDPTLGGPLTEAFRIDLSQSPVLRVLGDAEVARVLERMEQPANALLTPALAREIAEREGLPAVILGEVAGVGGGYVLSARVVASDGTELLAARETAAGETEILAALDRLSAGIRERVGESYRSLRASAPLEQVTTSSLEALRLFTRAGAAEAAGDFPQTITLLEQAVALDTAFASAYRLLAVTHSNSAGSNAAVQAAATAAYRHRNRLPPVERHMAEAYYYNNVEEDPDRVVAAYRAVLELDPEHGGAMNNLAIEYLALREWARADTLLARAMLVVDSATWQHFGNALDARFQQGREDAAWEVMAAFERRHPGNPAMLGNLILLLFGTGQYDSAAVVATGAQRGGAPPGFADFTIMAQASVRAVQGQYTSAHRMLAARERVMADAGRSGPALGFAVERAQWAARVFDRPADAARMIDDALRRYPLQGIAAEDRPYPALIAANVLAGRLDQARALRAQWEQAVPRERRDADEVASTDGYLALGEGRAEPARQAFTRAYARAGCNACLQDLIARTWDLEGNADSALAAYERYLTLPDMYRMFFDPGVRQEALRRAGGLHEQLGHRDQAIQRYGELLDLWRDADAELAPIKDDIRQRIARLNAQRN